MFSKLISLLHSPSGGYIVRRYISILGHIICSIVVLKLTWCQQLTEEYFLIYMSMIAGHSTIDKFVAHKFQKSETKSSD